MKVNYRWLLQAISFVGAVFSFLQVWERSKLLFDGYNLADLILIALFMLMFFFCFFLMTLTSYLKQKFNDTLKNPIPFFERVIARTGLESLRPRNET